eukprot:768392-Hanusia_phi.AAC.19
MQSLKHFPIGYFHRFTPPASAPCSSFTIPIVSAMSSLRPHPAYRATRVIKSAWRTKPFFLRSDGISTKAGRPEIGGAPGGAGCAPARPGPEPPSL